MEASQFIATDALTRDEQDLKWFFNHRPRPVGLVSSHGAVVHRLLLMPEDHGNPEPSRDVLGDALDDARRRARVEGILAATRDRSVELLRVAFERAPQRLQGYGMVANLVEHTFEAEAAHAQSKSRLPLNDWLAHLHRRSASSLSARRTKESLLLAAHQLLRRILLEYREGKRRTGLTGRAAPMPVDRQGGSHA